MVNIREVPIICESCDSEYSLFYVKENVIGQGKYCPFCGESVESKSRDYEEDYSDEDEEENEWSDE